MLSPIASFMLMIGFAALLVASIRRIPEGQVYTLRRIGGHMRTVGSGLHVILPIVERVIHKIRLLGNVVSVKVPTSTGEMLCGNIYVQVLDARRADDVIDTVSDLLSSRVSDIAVTPVTEDDAERNRRIKMQLNSELGERGLLITRVQLTNT
jgi:regulator of protease activity HflC (stomatin/prohibitin superfamily)